MASINSNILKLAGIGLGASAVAGFGAAMGRDAYKATKKNLLFIAAIAAAAVLPFLGARRMVRGYRTTGAASWGFISGVLLIVSGLIPAVLLGAFGASHPGLTPSIFGLGFLVLGAIAILSTLIGWIAGVASRSKRFRAFRIEDTNIAFLQTNGITASEGDDVQYFDGDGNALRVLETIGKAIVLMPVGTRNKRAYITMTADGEMLEYSGVVPIADGVRYVG